MNKQRLMKLAGILKEGYGNIAEYHEEEIEELKKDLQTTEDEMLELDFDEELSIKDNDDYDPEYSEDKLGDYYGQTEEDAEEENIKDYIKYGKSPIQGDYGPFAKTYSVSEQVSNISSQQGAIEKWLPYFSKAGFSEDGLEMVKPEVVKLLGTTLKSYIENEKSQQSTKGQVDYVEGHKKGIEDYKKGEYMAYKTKSPSDPTLVDAKGTAVPNKLINFAKGYIKAYKDAEEKDEAKL